MKTKLIKVRVALKDKNEFSIKCDGYPELGFDCADPWAGVAKMRDLVQRKDHGVTIEVVPIGAF